MEPKRKSLIHKCDLDGDCAYCDKKCAYRDHYHETYEEDVWDKVDRQFEEIKLERETS